MNSEEVSHDIKMAIAIIERRGKELCQLAARYDDALKRINDLEAELEHLRREVNR